MAWGRFPAFPSPYSQIRGLRASARASGTLQRARYNSQDGGRGEILQAILRGVEHGTESRPADPPHKGSDRAGKQRGIPHRAGKFPAAYGKHRRGIQGGEHVKKVIRLRQCLRHTVCLQIVADRHGKTRPAGGGYSLHRMGSDPIRPRRCGQYRKAEAVLKQGGEVYRFVPAKKNAPHAGMP